MPEQLIFQEMFGNAEPLPAPQEFARMGMNEEEQFDAWKSGVKLPTMNWKRNASNVIKASDMTRYDLWAAALDQSGKYTTRLYITQSGFQGTGPT